MKLSDHIAVVFKATGSRQEIKQVLSASAYAHLLQLTSEGHFVILEAWTMGKCISN